MHYTMLYVISVMLFSTSSLADDGEAEGVIKGRAGLSCRACDGDLRRVG